MGIQDMYPLLAEHAPHALSKYHLSNFRGWRVAIDISIFLYKYVRSSGAERWIDQFVLLLCTLKKHGLRPICIFDGDTQPIEKAGEQERRRGELQKSTTRLKQCIVMRDRLQNEYINIPLLNPDGTVFDQPEFAEDLKNECRILIGEERSTEKKQRQATNYYNVSDVIASLSEIITRLDRQTMPITKEYRERAIELLKVMGISYFVADGEAEGLCAYMSIKGLADCVLTEDSDVLPYGTPFMLAFKDLGIHQETVYCLSLDVILESLELNLESFRDLCILLSCDYNNRIKGFPPDGKKYKKPVCIGLKHAYTMIKEYKTLENAANYIEDIEPLKYPRCRELLSPPKDSKVANTAKIDTHRPIDVDGLKDIIERFKITINLDYILRFWKETDIVFE